MILKCFMCLKHNFTHGGPQDGCSGSLIMPILTSQAGHSGIKVATYLIPWSNAGNLSILLKWTALIHLNTIVTQQLRLKLPAGHFNKKCFFTSGDSHHKCKVSLWSYLYNGHQYTCKDGIYIETELRWFSCSYQPWQTNHLDHPQQ